MLFELIIFAVVLVILQAGVGLLVGYLSMNYFMSGKFLKKYLKRVMKVATEVTEEFYEEN